MSSNVAIVDFRLCNLDSIRRAIEECGGRAVVARDARDLKHADRIVLPGVGSFAQAMANLAAAGFDRALPEAVLGEGVPLLGICLGMQLLGERGTEHGDALGLGFLKGNQIKMTAVRPEERVPHIGWNEIAFVRHIPLFDGVPDRSDFYFAHSYCLDCPDNEMVATVPTCGGVAAAAARGNVMAVQFHPEKSQAFGFQVIKNFLAL